MKKCVIGFILGVLLTISMSVYAEDGLLKVESYLRPNLPISLDGHSIALDNAPLMYNGNTYLRLRDISKLTGLFVNWNETTQTVELSTTAPIVPPPTPGGATVPDAVYGTPLTTNYDGLIQTRGASIIGIKGALQMMEANDPRRPQLEENMRNIQAQIDQWKQEKAAQ